MGSHLQRLFCTLLVLLIRAAASSTSSSVARPGCRDHCGNVTIPYPFGIGKDCYKNEWFQVICNTSANDSLPFLASIRHKVLYFSLGGHLSLGGRFSSKGDKFRIQSPVISSGCSGQVDDLMPALNLTGSPFFISSNNLLTAVGCNNKALMTGIGSQIVGCAAACENEAQFNQIGNNSCIGYRCCQTAIPPDLQVFEASVDKLQPDKSGCQLAYLTPFDLYPSMFTSPELVEYKNYTTMELDWRLDIPSYNPDGSSDCMITSTILTNVEYKYYCWCKSGYTGNPYLPGGCQDIDECREPNRKACGRNKCVNVPGSYRCEKTWPAILGGSLGSGLLLLFVGMWWLCKTSRKRRKARQKKKFFKRNGGLLLQQQTSSGKGRMERTKLFSSKQLEKATNRFNEGRMLGQGGQGTVYKGMLADGRIVAVKKSKAVEKENLEEFINEIIILSQINHRNVVKILGCCLETEVPVLVYEFIPNVNLFEHLQNPSEEFPLTWEVRMRIASEAADALSYLHSAASIPIYHRDVKSTNILLDEKYRAKVSDFGISRSVPIDQTHLTTIVQGTIGYVDPEYLQSSHFTEKSDVYSFGVVLVELLTGEKPLSPLRPQEGRLLAAHFLESMRHGKLQDIVDTRINGEGDQHKVLAAANLTRRCLSLDSESRPTMREVFTELERIRSPNKGTQFQAQDAEECGHIGIDLPESLTLFYTSPDIGIDTGSSSSDAEPLVPGGHGD